MGKLKIDSEIKRVLIKILVIFIVLISGWFVLNWKTENPKEVLTIPDIVNDFQVTIKIDRKKYRVGEDIIITIKNNLIRSIRYYDRCSLYLCQYHRDDWICEMRECHGPMIVLESGGSKEMKFDVRDLVEMRLKYKFAYQMVSEDTIYVVDSNEFTIEEK